MAKSIEKSDN